ncbi:MAG: tetratricopeptide repeat protein, partial [Deltaproteobacteria bacterium]|nr:tetratricopeptide repeat protein [Deltaproteobacteria bacterium]
MAIKDMDQDLIPDEFWMDLPTTLLPPFPRPNSILTAMTEVVPGMVELGKNSFVAWVDFALENPDEIWEMEEVTDKRMYHYLTFFGESEGPPVFAVEVTFHDDAVEINDFALILDESDITLLRSGNLVYCRRLEWERERLVKTLNEQALMKYDQERLDEALELIDAAIRLSGHASAYLFNNRGLICWKMGKIDQAKRDFLESIHLDSTNGDPYFNIGLIYFDECDFGRALYYLRRAVDINPLDSQFITELGHLYLELEREDEALRLFQRAFENDPGDAQVDFHLGHYFLYKKRQPRDAVKYYRQGLEKDPYDQFALADLALAHWILGNKRKTLEIHNIIQKCSNLMPYTVSRLVYLNMEMGDYESALIYYRKALSQNDPFEPEWLHYNAALAYAQTGRSKQALDILDLAVKAGGEAVIRKALSEKALEQLKRMPDFKKLIKLPSKRR